MKTDGMKAKMKLVTKILVTTTTVFAIFLCGTPAGIAKVLMYTPDGRILHLKGGTAQPDLSRFRSPLESKILSRRFITNQNVYLANEGYATSQTGFNDMVKAGLPVAYKPEFHWVVHQEAYWHARYLLQWMGAASRLGISMVQGPYWTLKARDYSQKNKFTRDRGERVMSNKDILMGIYFPMYYKLIGFPRVFESAFPTHLQYASGDPHFMGPVHIDDDFEDPQSGKKGKWGVPRYFFDWTNLRWDHDEMDTTFHMGGVAQLLKRRAQWTGYMFHSTHVEQSPSDPSLDEVTLLGNDAEEGLRGMILATTSVNTMLQLKASMFADEAGKKLGGINPVKYDPSKGLRYIPHTIKPNILWVGDLPERLWSMEIGDNSSQLWDQASWIWSTAEFSHFVLWYDNRIFTDNPPADGGLLEKNVGKLSRGISNVVVKNLQAMHLKNDVLVSEWTPKKGTGNVLSMKDATMAMIALKEYADHAEFLEEDEELIESADTMMLSTADFLLEVQGQNGSFFERYDVSSSKGIGENILSAPNWAGIRALIAAYQRTGEEKYTEAARKTFNLLNTKYWVEEHGLYRTRLGDDTVILTPYLVGINLSALREMMFATPLHLVEPQLDRLTRWWVQTMDMSGMQQAEDNRTGELAYGTTGYDEDADGIPFVAGGGSGEHGIAPMAAGKVAINIGGPDNEAFAKLEGEKHNIQKYAKVKFAYQPKPREEQLALTLPVKIPQEGLIKRPVMQKYNGTIISLPASMPVERGLGIKLGLSGQEIFEINCSLCHGFSGEGITGMSFERDAFKFSHDEMAKVPIKGRHEKLMPPWVNGNKDSFGGPLTEEEIHMIVDYVQSDEFRKKFKDHEKGLVVAGAPPKDPYEYISREYAKAGSKSATAEDYLRVAAKQPKASEFVPTVYTTFYTRYAEWKKQQSTMLAEKVMPSGLEEEQQAGKSAKDKQAGKSAKDKQAGKSAKDKQAGKSAKDKQAGKSAKDKQAGKLSRAMEEQRFVLYQDQPLGAAWWENLTAQIIAWEQEGQMTKQKGGKSW